MISSTEIALAIGAFLMLGKKATAAAGSGSIDAALLRRANQARAHEWIGVLIEDLGLPEEVAEAVARWFGIESSGDPFTVSAIGERGLAQITKTSALTEKALTSEEWDELISPTTSPQDQARLSMKVIDWCYGRASKYIATPPISSIAHLWYAKIYHQMPTMVRDGKMTGNAAADSRRLEKQWSSDEKRIRYLHAANVVAWNSIEPPTGAA